MTKMLMQPRDALLRWLDGAFPSMTILQRVDFALTERDRSFFIAQSSASIQRADAKMSV